MTDETKSETEGKADESALVKVDEGDDIQDVGKALERDFLASKQDETAAANAAADEEQARRVAEHQQRQLDADKRRGKWKLPASEKLEVTISRPGYVYKAMTEAKVSDLRNGAKSDKIVRGLIEELQKQF